MKKGRDGQQGGRENTVLKVYRIEKFRDLLDLFPGKIETLPDWSTSTRHVASISLVLSSSATLRFTLYSLLSVFSLDVNDKLKQRRTVRIRQVTYLHYRPRRTLFVFPIRPTTDLGYRIMFN